jgi:hypothetical protein
MANVAGDSEAQDTFIVSLIVAISSSSAEASEGRMMATLKRKHTVSVTVGAAVGSRVGDELGVIVGLIEGVFVVGLFDFVVGT